MIKMLKSIIWLVGLAVVAYLVLDYFGYTVNRDYFNESKEECQKRLSDCQKELIRKGTEGAQCNFDCVNMGSLIIKKK